MIDREYYVYIMTNPNNTVIYTGLTNSLYRRVLDHKQKRNPYSFTSKYNVVKLIYYESFEYIYDAIAREKRIKGWIRKKKIDLIKSVNPEFKDLFEEMRDESP